MPTSRFPLSFFSSRSRRFARVVRTALKLGLIATIPLSIAYGVYLSLLFRQLQTAFANASEFVPTRIYSDVTRIAPAQPKRYIESRLRSLGYAQKIEGRVFSFQLRDIRYPDTLVPEGHLSPSLNGQRVTLEFDTEREDAVLQSIATESQELSELYLEPELVATLARAGEGKIRELLQFQEIPAIVWKSIIAIEDQHFMEHSGIDPRGLMRAFWVNLKTFSLAQGGSTLSLQLVKNLMQRRGKSLIKKFSELFLVLLMEMKYDKDQILARYLNEVYLGQVGNLEIHGVAEGAKHFFGKSLAELHLGEVAVLAGLIRGPAYYSPYRNPERILARKKLVLQKMVETGLVAEEEAQRAQSLPLRFAPAVQATNRAPYFSDYVKAELIEFLKVKIPEGELAEAGLRVYTTLDPYLNDISQRAVSSGVLKIEERFNSKKDPALPTLEGAFAAVDHRTGYLRALIGGRSYDRSTFNRILNMKRQVGSTFKPIVYLAALEKQRDSRGIPYTGAYPMEDAPWKLIFDRGKQTWEPRNYEKDFMGWISFRTALAHSVNTIAARLGVEVGLSSVIALANRLGIESEMPSVPSLSLGVTELSPVELVRVYSTIANRGVADEVTVIRAITEEDGTALARFVYHPKEVIEPALADLLTDLLREVMTEGTGKSAAAMGFTAPSAGKTGTTSNYRDAWFAGYTPTLTAVSWVGVDSGGASDKGKNKIQLTGAGSALPIWVDVMKAYAEISPPESFPWSEDLKDVRMDRFTGQAATADCPSSQVLIEKLPKRFVPTDFSCEVLWPKSTPVSRIED
jgi:penicillin-binding protein 1B